MTRVAIVTPYFREPADVLVRCLDSVAGQSVATDHIVIADGHPQPWVAERPLRHIVLSPSCGNYGNTPRAVGAMLAVGEGYEAIGFLDADNWLEPDHLERCLRAAEGARNEALDYVLARRNLLRTDGTPLGDPPVEDTFEADTNCCLFFPGAYHLLALWGTIPGALEPVADRVLYQALRYHKLAGLRLAERTVNYVTRYAGTYLRAGEAPPPDAKGVDIDAIGAWIDSLEGRQLEIAERWLGVPIEKSPQAARAKGK